MTNDGATFTPVVQGGQVDRLTLHAVGSPASSLAERAST